MPGRLKIAVLYEPSDNVTPQAAQAAQVAQASQASKPEPAGAGSGRARHKPRPSPLAPRRKRERRAHDRSAPKLDREQVLEALRKCGHDPFFHELKGDESLLALARTPADLVFNMVEAFDGDDSKEAHVAAFLELLDLRYTGAGPQALFLAQDKALAKKIFGFHGILTPNFATSYRGKIDHIDDLQFPLIVKPASEDGSVGIDSGSVVKSIKELMERISLIQEQFDCPALIEEFIEGREIYVGVLGNGKPQALPVVELDLSKLPKGMPHIAGKEVKWETGTEAYDVTKSALAKGLDDAVREKLSRTALQVYEALKLRDYGRVDMRLTDDGRVYVIEANPNPWLAPEAELAIAAAQAGRGYADLIGQIVELALARYAA